MNAFTDQYGRRLPLLQPIGVRPIDVLEASHYRSTAAWNAALAAKYGDDWQDEPTTRDLELEQSNG
jgi:hypothetical protein